jgi:plasmid replication initiation protein
MCKAKEYLGTFSMSVEEVRSWLGIEEHELPSVKNLRKCVLDVPKAELDKKADLSFTYEPTKTGRRITGWTFKVKKNHPRPVQRQLPLRDRDQEPEDTPEIRAKNKKTLDDCKREINGTVTAPFKRVKAKGSRV